MRRHFPLPLPDAEPTDAPAATAAPTFTTDLALLGARHALDAVRRNPLRTLVAVAAGGALLWLLLRRR